ncbi:MAG: amidase family protein, partial [Actinomycetota bacterium]
MTSLADETRWLDATSQAELVATGKVSPVELVDAAIERIEKYDPALNALTYRWFEQARRLASSDSLPAGPFRGVPYLLKDLYAYESGKPVSNGNKAFKAAGYVADADTTLVSRYKSAGLVSLGRTNSPELGSVPVTEPEAWGPTRNPWNLDRTPGGSSGGAAAAVAAGLVPIAHASDGGGSIRIP